MGELAFVGLGLSDERGVSPESLDVLAASDVVFAEEYTASAPSGTLDRLSARIGRPIRSLDRAALESERPVLEALAGASRVALVTVGDPFAATTHVALRLAAERAGHGWSYHPAASVVAAVPGFLGLMAYRFGRTVSIPFPAPGFAPRSPVDQIGANRAAGLHSLVLLDLDPAHGRYLLADAALREIRARDPDGAVVPDAAVVAVAARVGRREAAGFAGEFCRLRERDFGPPMHAIVVPAPTLHEQEAAALARFRVE